MKFDDATLMAFHDGELDPDTARRVRIARLVDPRLNARLEGLEQLGDFVRVWATMRDARVRVAPRPRMLRRPAAARATGVAAALFGLTLLVPSALPPRAPASEARFVAPPAAAPVFTAPPAPPSPAVAVENVDFGTRHGAIFLVQSARSETTVVWLPEGPGPSTTGTL